MKILKLTPILVLAIMTCASVCAAEEWYQAMERSSNDYRGSVGGMIADVDGSKFTPRYSQSELNNTRIAADARQVSQAGVSAVQASIAHESTPMLGSVSSTYTDIPRNPGSIGSFAGGMANTNATLTVLGSNNGDVE